jgi:hypothetical protein
MEEAPRIVFGAPRQMNRYPRRSPTPLATPGSHADRVIGLDADVRSVIQPANTHRAAVRAIAADATAGANPTADPGGAGQTSATIRHRRAGLANSATRTRRAVADRTRRPARSTAGTSSPAAPPRLRGLPPPAPSAAARGLGVVDADTADADCREQPGQPTAGQALQHLTPRSILSQRSC